jgi:hypothetical protein
LRTGPSRRGIGRTAHMQAERGVVHSAGARAERAASARAYLALRTSSSSTAAGSRPRAASST